MTPVLKFYLCVSFIILAVTGFAQDSAKKKMLVKDLVETKQFVFVPNMVSPQRGGTRFLDGYFDFKVNKDSLVSYLPYFGSSDIAPVGTDDAGINFTSTDFSYAVNAGKKGRYIISIKVNNQLYGYKFLLTVFSDGTAGMNVTSTYKDQISFRGIITALK